MFEMENRNDKKYTEAKIKWKQEFREMSELQKPDFALMQVKTVNLSFICMASRGTGDKR